MRYLHKYDSEAEFQYDYYSGPMIGSFECSAGGISVAHPAKYSSIAVSDVKGLPDSLKDIIVSFD